MAVKVSRESSIGSGMRSFRFENVPDRARDQQQYKEGLALEGGRLRHGSIAQLVFDRLSFVNNSGSRPSEAPSEHLGDAADDAA